MDRGQILAVDFEKRELKGSQQNSDNDKQSFYNAVAEGKFGLGVYRTGDKE